MVLTNRAALTLALLACLGVALVADPALAYVGPGAGPEIIGYFASLVGWLVLAGSTVLLYPLHCLKQRFWSKTPAVTNLVPQPVEQR